MDLNFQYRDQWYSLAPPWLTTGDAEKYMYTLQLCTDVLLEKMNQAIRIRLPGLGDPSQLPYLANDRVLVQGLAESDANFAIRLQEAFPTWGLAGSARAVLMNLQAYMQGLQPGVPLTNPLLTIVGGNASVFPVYITWHQLYQGDAIGALPTLTTSQAVNNFIWDTLSAPWRSWLILPMALVHVASGTGAATTTASGGSFTQPGQNVAGVWVPATSGTPINTPFVHVTGVPGSIGQWVTLSGSSHPGNNGTFPIVAAGADVTIANPNGIAPDAGPISWSLGEYPWIAPGMPYGSPGIVYGQGELQIPEIDTGHLFGGVWQPSANLEQGLGSLTSWGLNISPDIIASIRSLVKTWKSAGTYYPNIIVAFDCGTGVAGSAYSPNSIEGAGNPNGSFGPVGHNVGGVWVPTRLITSPYDCYCQGTGTYQACSVENVS